MLSVRVIFAPSTSAARSRGSAGWPCAQVATIRLPAPPSTSRREIMTFDTDRSATLRGLEQLNHIAGGILQQDLGSTRTGDDIVAKLDASAPQPFDLGPPI